MVYPIILYHGRSQFKYPLDYLNLVDGNSDDINTYLRGGLCMLDLNTMTDTQLLNSPHFPLTLSLLFLKHIYDEDMLDLLNNTDNIVGLFKRYAQKSGEELALALLRYIYSTGKISNITHFANVVSQIRPGFEEDIMSAEQAAVERGKKIGFNEGMQQGMQQGVQQGMQQGVEQGVQQAAYRFALKMLAMGKSAKEVAGFCELSLKEVTALVSCHAKTMKE